MMKIGNYLPQLAEKFPTLYIEVDQSVFQEVRKSLNIAEMAKAINVKKNTLRNIFNGVSACSLGILSKIINYLQKPYLWDSIYQTAAYLRGKTFTVRVKFPKELTKELAYLMGAFRDAALSTYKSEIIISQKNKKWLEQEILPKLKNVFGIEPTIYGPREKDGCYYIKIRSVALFAIIKVLFEWKKGRWNTPSMILTAPLELKKEYIRGFWDAEGSNNKKGGLEIFQAWESFEECPPLRDLKKMLEELGIESWFTKPQKGVNKPVHRLYIPKRFQEKFFNVLQPFKR